jgi:hypothetical protein
MMNRKSDGSILLRRQSNVCGGKGATTSDCCTWKESVVTESPHFLNKYVSTHSKSEVIRKDPIKPWHTSWMRIGYLNHGSGCAKVPCAGIDAMSAQDYAITLEGI